MFIERVCVCMCVKPVNVIEMAAGLFPSSQALPEVHRWKQVRRRQHAQMGEKNKGVNRPSGTFSLISKQSSAHRQKLRSFRSVFGLGGDCNSVQSMRVSVCFPTLESVTSEV